MKKIFVVLIIITLIFSLAGCSGQSGDEPKNSEPKKATKKDYPTRPITLIIPYGPGGGCDTQARILETFFKDEFGQGLNFVYKQGAGGAVGTAEAAKAAPDGYNMLSFGFPHVVLFPLSGTGKWEPLEDFDYLAQVASDPQVLVVPKESPFNTLEDFITYAKDNPEKVNISLPGLYGGAHNVQLRLFDMAGINVKVIPFQGGSAQTAALLGGEVDSGLGNFANLSEEIKAGNIKALAVSAEERRKEISNTPTFKELGYNIISTESRIWMVPKGVETKKLERLREGIEKIWNKPEYQKKMIEAGYTLDWISGEDFEQYLKDYEKEAKVLLEKAGLLKK